MDPGIDKAEVWIDLAGRPIANDGGDISGVHVTVERPVGVIDQPNMQHVRRVPLGRSWRAGTTPALLVEKGAALGRHDELGLLVDAEPIVMVPGRKRPTDLRARNAPV